jgi:hypothetical protein
VNTQVDKNTVNPAGEVTIKSPDPDPDGDLARDLLSRARQAMSKRTLVLVESGTSAKSQGQGKD